MSPFFAHEFIDLSYSHDALGRITQENDQAGGEGVRNFTYDGLDRLVSATGSWGTANYTYDALNNITQRQIGSRVVDIQYDSQNRVGQVRDTAVGSWWQPYTHDSRGNVISNGLLAFGYDHANQPTSMSGTDTGTFVYDGNMRRAKQTINGETIYSVYNARGQLLLRDNATTGQVTDYAYFGNRVVRRTTAGSAWTMHQDALGSTRAASWTSTVLWREAYTPFGEPLTNPSQNHDQRSYTGHIQDTDTGLTYMQARYYDPAIGRFLSTDPVGFIAGGPMYFNRYAYVGNNPINATDPSGEFGVPGAIIGGLVGGAIGAISSGVSEAVEQHNAGQGFNGWEIASNALVGGASGAVAGAVVGSGVGLVGAVATGALYGAADAGLDVALDAAFGDDVSDRNVAGEMAVGAAAGAAGPIVGKVLQGGRVTGDVVNATVRSGTTTTTVSAPALVEEIGETIVTETAIQTTTQTIDAIEEEF